MKNILSALVALVFLLGNPSVAEVVMKIDVSNPEAIVFSAVPNSTSSINTNVHSTYSGISLINVLAEDPALDSESSLSPNFAAASAGLEFYNFIWESEILTNGSALSLNIWRQTDDDENQEFQIGVQAFKGQATASANFQDVFRLKAVGTVGDIVTGYIPGSLSAVLGQWEIVGSDAGAGGMFLEEPINGEVHGGIGNLRGYAVFEAEVERVEIYIDGEYAFDAPYGGERTDVEAVFPEIPGSRDSGFSLAYGYSNLVPGEHTITALAVGPEGVLGEDTSTFTVQSFKEAFIASNEIVDGSTSDISMENDEIVIRSIQVGGSTYNLVLKWRTAEQGFEIVEILEDL